MQAKFFYDDDDNGKEAEPAMGLMMMRVSPSF